MILGTLGASVLGHVLTGKEVEVKIPERGAKRTGEWAIATSRGRKVNISGLSTIE